MAGGPGSRLFVKDLEGIHSVTGNSPLCGMSGWGA